MISRRLTFAAVLVVALAGGIAYAAIPDADTGTYHACMLKNVGTIRIIDPAKQHCSATLETEITFGARGAQGLPGASGAPGTNGTNGTNGANGVSPTVEQIGPGPNCPTGGAAITDARGSVAYVCNGAIGATGSAGAPGADGAPFSGTFTSPNGRYSISVSDTGIQLMSNDGTGLNIQAGNWDARSKGVLSLTADGDTTFRSGANIEVRGGQEVRAISGTDIKLTASTNAVIQSGLNTSIAAGANATIQAAGQAALKASGSLGLLGTSISVNGGPGCLPAARTTDQITVQSTGLTGSVSSGSQTVCIG